MNVIIVKIITTLLFEVYLHQYNNLRYEQKNKRRIANSNLEYLGQ